jgi:diguanylate cyclase (GGDEF)-like protein
MPLSRVKKGCACGMKKAAHNFRYDIIAVCVLLAMAVFLLDISVPLGISVGALYSLIVLFSLASNNSLVTMYITAGCAALLIVGLIAAFPEQDSLWIALLNRALYLIVIWITARFGMRLQKAQQQLLRQEAGLQQINRELEQQARHDSLTGVANRRYFDEELEAECERANRGETPLALLMVDVDLFKPYNDINGHQAGDECLTRIAQAIADKVRRPGDLVARYGGEEFAVILPVTTQDGAAARAEGIRQAVERLGIYHSDPRVNGPTTISVGVASIWPGARRITPAALISAADAALYRAKNDGRNCVRIADGETSALP